MRISPSVDVYRCLMVLSGQPSVSPLFPLIQHTENVTTLSIHHIHYFYQEHVTGVLHEEKVQ